MKKLRLYQVDAFTSRKFYGNPAGIILGAEDLSTEQMQLIARELNNTESAFVMKSDGDDHDIRVRFFTPTTEVPMCGHNTIALHATRAMIGDCGVGDFVQKTKAGLIPVRIQKSNGNFYVTMTQSSPSFDVPIYLEEAEPLIKALGISRSDVQSEWPIQIVSTGNRKLFLGVRSKEVLHSIKPDMRDLAKLGKKFECTGYYIFTIDTHDRDALTHGRMFGPQVGIDEDPVTGTGMAPLGAYIVKNNLVRADKEYFEFNAKQGEAMGRPGFANVKVFLDADSQPSKILVSGEAVIVFSTELLT